MEDPCDRIKQQAANLFVKHGLSEWRFHLDKAKTRAGCCHFRTKTITMSSDYVAAAKQHKSDNTLLHEIAHALVGGRHGHDKVWKAKAIEIGCDGKRCHNVSFSEKSYVVRCDCGKCVIRRHKVDKRLLKKVCKHCRGPLRKYSAVLRKDNCQIEESPQSFSDSTSTVCDSNDEEMACSTSEDSSPPRADAPKVSEEDDVLARLKRSGYRWRITCPCGVNQFYRKAKRGSLMQKKCGNCKGELSSVLL